MKSQELALVEPLPALLSAVAGHPAFEDLLAVELWQFDAHGRTPVGWDERRLRVAVLFDFRSAYEHIAAATGSAPDFDLGKITLATFDTYWSLRRLPYPQKAEEVLPYLSDHDVEAIARGSDPKVVEWLRSLPTRPDDPAQPAKCATCGGNIFVATPDTSANMVRAFAQASRHPLRDEMLRHGWIRPGEHCPNGCHSVVYTDMLSAATSQEGYASKRAELRLQPPVPCDPDESGWITCPGCEIRWTLRDPRFVAGPGLWEHRCGWRVVTRT